MKMSLTHILISFPYGGGALKGVFEKEKPIT
jgi:hypothetical protein